MGTQTHFLSDELSACLRNQLLSLQADGRMKAAGIGNKSKLQVSDEIRSDTIYWLDRKHNNIYENLFFTQIEAFIKYLNRTCYAGITGHEFHYAYYDIGSFYKKHLDQFQNDQNRAYSMIFYLNPSWETVDGGELCIYQKEGIQLISPLEGTCVFFKSDELEHEVLLNYAPRLSITGWLKTGF